MYDTAFLTAYTTAIGDPARWQAEADRYGIQTAIIFHRFENDRVLAGRVEGTRAYARFLATIGHAEPAVAAYLNLVALGIPAAEEVERRLLVARYFISARRHAEAQEQLRLILAVDPNNADARRLLQ